MRSVFEDGATGVDVLLCDGATPGAVALGAEDAPLLF